MSEYSSDPENADTDVPDAVGLERKRRLRSLKNRRAAVLRHACSDSLQNTAAARRAFLDRFLQAVDEAEPGLPDAERRRRADGLRRAHMLGLSIKAAEARGSRRNRT